MALDGAHDLGAAGGPGDPTSAILDRLDSIGRLLARPARPEARHDEGLTHLGTRIDMLGQIVETLLADRDEIEAALAAVARRLVDLEATLAPALRACGDRLDALVPLLAEAALDRQPGPGAALRAILMEVRDAILALERRAAPPLPPLDPPATPRHEAASRPGPAPPESDAGPASAPLVLTSPLPPEAEAAPPGPGARDEARDEDGDEALRRALARTMGEGPDAPPT